MSQNTQPIFVLTPNVSWAKLQTAPPSGSHLGSGSLGTDIQTIFTSGDSGSRIDEVRIVSLGTNSDCVVRLFLNNGGDNNVLTNNTLFEEIPIAASSLSETIAVPVNILTYTNGVFIPSGSRVIAGLGLTISTGLHITVFGGNY